MTRKKITVCFFFIGMLVLLMYPIQQLNAARATGTVKNRVLNVRSKASTSSSIVCKLSKGTKVTIISETTGDDGLKWYNVYFAHDGGTAEGYVRADLVTVSGTVSNGTTSNDTDTSSSGDTLYVDKASVRVRKSAMVGSEIVAGLERGNEVTSKGTTTGSDGQKWTKVSFTKDGKKLQGYIRSDLLTSKKPSSSNDSSSSSGDSEYLYVKASSVHVRESANPSADSVAGLSKGAEVKVKSTKTGTDGRKWTKVSFTQDGKKIQGYIRSDLLTSDKPAGSNNNNNNNNNDSDDDILYVSASAVRVRTSASNSADVVANLLKGDQVKKKSTRTGDDGKEWTKVSFTISGTKYQGYIRSDLLTSTRPSDSQGDSGSSGGDGEEYKYVNVSAIRVRESASTSAQVVANLLKGDKVKVKSTKTGADGKEWTKVSFTINGTKYHGYIRSDYLSKKKPSDEDNTSSSLNDNNSDSGSMPSSGTVRLAIINVRKSATTGSSIVAKVSQGTKMTIKSETTGSDGKKWYKISCKYNGSTISGYVRSDLLNY